MNPAFSVIFLTTLIGAGQGLFIATVLSDISRSTSNHPFVLISCVISLGLLVAGLFASFFHLGRPERAWRAATKWRTSWLSREVIVLPMAMLSVIAFGTLHYLGNGHTMLIQIVGWAGIGVMAALFACTGMIYACVRFLQEWASPVTLINFTLLGLASGFFLATALALHLELETTNWFFNLAILLLVFGLLSRLYSFYRNRNLKAKSSIQSAIGIKHRHIKQRAMGHTGGSFNTRAFFHHCSTRFMKNMPTAVILLVFVIPAILLIVAVVWNLTYLAWLSVAIQYLGLVAERWLFFAQANHPQNLYYQTVS